MTTRKLTLTRAERKARFLELAEQQFELLYPEKDEPEVYSTESPDLWPRRARSRRHARDLIRAVPGHGYEGNGRARRYYVDAELYRKHWTHRPTVKVAPPPTAAAAANDATDEEIAERALESAGLRATRRAG